jgi:hypothetical protein
MTQLDIVKLKFGETENLLDVLTQYEFLGFYHCQNKFQSRAQNHSTLEFK